MIMTEVTPLVDAQLGAFFLVDDEQAVSGCGWPPPTRYREYDYEVTHARFGPARGWSARPRSRAHDPLTGPPPDCIRDRLRAGQADAANVWSCCRCSSRARCSA